MCIKVLTQPRIRWILISRRNIPLLHLCETWQTGSFPRLHSFDELFKSQSRDSFCLVTVKTCHWKWEILIVKLYSPYFIVLLWLLVRALECRLLIMSMCYRKPSIKWNRSRDLTNILITDKAWNEFRLKRWKRVENGLKAILTFEEFRIFNIQMYPIGRHIEC